MANPWWNPFGSDSSKQNRRDSSSASPKEKTPTEILDETEATLTAQLAQLKRSAVGPLALQQKLAKQIEASDASAHEAAHRAKLAIKASDEAAARDYLIAKRQCEFRSKVLNEQMSELQGAVTSIREAVIACDRQISEFRNKRQSLQLRELSARSSLTVAELDEQFQFGKIGDALNALEQQVTETEAMVELRGQRVDLVLERKFRELEAAPDAVQGQVAALNTRDAVNSNDDPELEEIRRLLREG
jgi:phage shock protein A